MTPKENIHPLDEEFAAATDAFFAGKLKEDAYEDAELNVLLNTLQKVDEAFTDGAEKQAKERIRRNLQKAWFSEQEKKSVQKSSFRSKIRNLFWMNKRQTSLAFSIAMILLILVVSPFLFSSEPNMAGTAGNISLSKTFILLISLALGSTLIWALSRKK